MDYIEYAKQTSSNRVYPLSIAEGYQSGDIIAGNINDVQCVMFWHYCGFAYLSGKVTDPFLNRISEDYFRKETKRRFVLITDDEKVIQFFEGKDGLVMDQRKEYSFGDDVTFSKEDFHTDLRIEKIDASNIKAIQGRIIPAFSWESDDAFLKNGFGYVAMDGEQFAAIAFSAAVSSEEVDIGVETNEAYRNRGLARILAKYMIREIMANGKTPVWAHAAGNTASMKTALGVGFKEIHSNTIIRKA
ncbi:MAG: GNAT family N-acetyltransferase [Lachnospiraceae bacterium]|nr:GNAT family N-acetyltransferase [Lachnospiraceae bacterium]